MKEDLSRSELTFTSVDAFTALANCVATTGFSLEEATEAMRRLGSALTPIVDAKAQFIFQYGGVYAIVRDR